jgi:hypothetical protein
MADSKAVAARGTLIKRNATTIAELKDITPPALTRKSIDVSIHNSPDDQYVVGIRRKGELSVVVNFLTSGEATHENTTGLLAAWSNGSKDLFEIDFIDSGVWSFSGYVTNIALKDPVDGSQDATISIRPTGLMTITP